MLKANNKVNKMMLLIELETLVHLHADTDPADTDIFKTSSGCLKQVTTSQDQRRRSDIVWKKMSHLRRLEDVRFTSS